MKSGRPSMAWVSPLAAGFVPTEAAAVYLTESENTASREVTLEKLFGWSGSDRIADSAILRPLMSLSLWEFSTGHENDISRRQIRI
jgi:hypothetical protein